MYNQYNYYDREDYDNGSEYEEESQLMIEETDPFYEPTKKEIEEYAVELLSMTLPEDEHLLYMAREAMKAPMPECWETYQRANGDIYYKHKVTQQKLLQHPIEIEYRKKYQQEKEKAARKTLKSKVPLKNLSGGMAMGGGKPVLGGLGVGMGMGVSANSIGFGGVSNQFSSSNRMSGMIRGDPSEISLKNDSQLFAHDMREEIDYMKKYDKQLEELEESLKKRLNSLKMNQEQSHTSLQRRSRNNHNDQMDRLRREGQSEMSLEERLRNEKGRVSSELDREFQANLKREKVSVGESFDRNQKNAEIEFEASFNKKLFDDQSEIQRRLQAKSKQLQQLKSESELEKQAIQSKLTSQLEEVKKSMINSKSSQVSQQVESRVRRITQETDNKLRDLAEGYRSQFQKISKAIKGSPEDRVQEMMREKLNLQQISNKKIEMTKLKQRKTIEQEISLELMEEKKRLRKRVEGRLQLSEKEMEETLRLQELKEVESRKKEYERKWGEIQGQIYQRFKEKIQEFEIKKNKNLINIRESFIKEIEEKTGNMELQSSLNAVKLQIEEKRFETENKLKQIDGVKREMAYADEKLEKVNFNWKIYRAKGKEEITGILKKYLESKKVEIRELGGEPEQSNLINEALSEHLTQLKLSKKQLESDKSLLLRVFSHLQSNTVLHSYEKKKMTGSVGNPTKIQPMSYANSELLKKYNKDVRLMRENAKAIQEFQGLVKKAEVEDEYLDELEDYQLIYKIPQLREELNGFGMGEESELRGETGKKAGGSGGGVGVNLNLREIGGHTTDLLSTKKVRQIFNDHSRFLSGVKNELNNKLAQIRSISQLY